MHEQYVAQTSINMHWYQQMVVGAVVACLYADCDLALWLSHGVERSINHEQFKQHTQAGLSIKAKSAVEVQSCSASAKG